MLQPKILQICKLYQKNTHFTMMLLKFDINFLFTVIINTVQNSFLAAIFPGHFLFSYGRKFIQICDYARKYLNTVLVYLLPVVTFKYEQWRN